jgi:formamidopyrimidine-DNA glycosylase
MPELPEVETIARQIRPRLLGRRITGAELPWLRSLGGLSRAGFRSAVVGARIASVERRAKFVCLRLEREREPAGALLVHLRMSGRLHVDPTEESPSAYVRVALDLDDGRRLAFVDVRKFGRFTFAADPEHALAGLGPEPLGADFTPEGLLQGLRARRRRLKPLLLDQSFLAGLGNIYVDESLYRARLHPLLPSDAVSRPKAALLHGAIRAVLERAIERQGSSFDAFYRTPEGRPGGYQEEFQVYGRAGEPCARCGRALVRIVVGQRGTHLCPRCQVLPRRPGHT